MKAFISYSTTLDQIIALRLQTMAAVYGVTSYVPSASTRVLDAAPFTPQLNPEVQKNLADSDVVLAVITQQPDSSALGEMNWAVAQHKLLIPIVAPGVPPPFYAQYRPSFVVDPADPARAEQEIVRFLQEKQQSRTAQNALVALATLTVALLLFGLVAKES